MGRTPIVYVYGISDSGKTRLVERLLLLLIQKGVRVGTIKLSRSETLDFDTEGKDTRRHVRAGSMVTAATSLSNAAVFIPKQQKVEKLLEMMRLMGDLDLVIVEGIGDDVPESAPKIAVGEIKGRVPGTVMELPDAEGEIGSVLHILDRIMTKKEETDSIRLRVGGEDVQLNPFVREFLEGTIRGAMGALKDISKPGGEVDLHLPPRAEE